MRKVLLLVLVAAGVLATAASAITTNGFPDNGRHPNVGAILDPDERRQRLGRGLLGHARLGHGTS